MKISLVCLRHLIVTALLTGSAFGSSVNVFLNAFVPDAYKQPLQCGGYGSIFDGSTTTAGDCTQDLLFSDNPTFQHRFGFQIGQDVTLTDISLYAFGDGEQFGNQRDYSRFRLWAVDALFETTPGTADPRNEPVLLIDYTPDHPQSSPFLATVLTGTWTTNSFLQGFVAEFDSYIPDSGARVVELQAFNNAPEPSSLWLLATGVSGLMLRRRMRFPRI